MLMYTKDGRTLRQVFRTMSPTKHDVDQTKSELLAYIMSQLNCDMVAAARAFNSMRNTNSRVLVFDAIERVWMGCDWVPDNKEAREEYLIKEVRTWDRKVADVKSDITSIEKENYDLKKKLKKLEERFDWLEDKASRWLDALQDHTGIDCDNYTPRDEKQAENTDPRAAFGE